MKIRPLGALTALYLLLISRCVYAQTDWPVLGFVAVGTNTFQSPTCITHAGDGSGRLFVLEQTGRIWTMINGNVSTQPFLDITNRVLSGGERGLLGLAFPPGYVTNGHFYVDYTRQTDGATVISRFFNSTNNGFADSNSEQILKIIAQPFANHNGGQLAFGPDGYLYVGMGDGGYSASNGRGDPFNNAQNLSSLLGKLLRIDVESGVSPYGNPADNPFVGTTNAPEIWAYGLRNPWRFSFDRQTGDLYIGDVGHFRFEEVDFQPAHSAGGQNYGWRILEATNVYNRPTGFDTSTMTPPVFWYDHFVVNPASGSACVVGGYVYRGPSQPRLDGNYFVADYVLGSVWALRYDGSWQRQLVAQTNFAISTFGEDAQGQLYAADYKTGRIYQLTDAGLVCTPAFAVASGSTISSNYVAVTCPSPSASIHYTTNGVDPTVGDPAVASGDTIPIRNGLTNKLRAYRSDLSPSAVVSAVYKLQAATPVFTPAAGVFTNNAHVTIATATSNSTIFYTLGGATPTTNSLVYSGPLVFATNTTIRGIATAAGFSNSLIATATYSQAQVATPIFSPSSGPITNGTIITISCATPGAIIHYTLNGATPTGASPVYSGPLSISGDTTLSAIAIESGYVNSEVTIVYYDRVKATIPVFTPSFGPLTNGSSITISTATPDAQIYYTVDGSDPTTNATLYSGPLSFTAPLTLTARAFRSDLDPSDLLSFYFALISQDDTIVTTFVGQATAGFADGVGLDAQFSSPTALCIDKSGTMFVADSANNVIREVTRGGVVTTFAGTGVAGSQLGAATNSQFNFPTGVCVADDGTVYVAEPNNCNRLLKIDTNNNVSLVANLYPNCYYGPTFRQLEIDRGGTVYGGVWGAVRKFLDDGSAPVFAGTAACCSEGWGDIVGIGIDSSTNIYAVSSASFGLFSHVFKISPEGASEIFAGDQPGFSDGPRLVALFQQLQDATVDLENNVFVSDAGRIRKIRSDGWVSTFAGTGVGGYTNGLGASALFNSPTGLCSDNSGNIYVADAGNNCIRKISPKPVAPPLRASQIGDRIVVSWPVWASNYVLESTTNFSGESWVPSVDAVTSGINEISATNSIDVNTRYYRLHQN